MKLRQGIEPSETAVKDELVEEIPSDVLPEETDAVLNQQEEAVPLLSAIMDRYEPPMDEEEYIKAMISHFMALKDRSELG